MRRLAGSWRTSCRALEGQDNIYELFHEGNLLHRMNTRETCTSGRELIYRELPVRGSTFRRGINAAATVLPSSASKLNVEQAFRYVKGV